MEKRNYCTIKDGKPRCFAVSYEKQHCTYRTFPSVKGIGMCSSMIRTPWSVCTNPAAIQAAKEAQKCQK